MAFDPIYNKSAEAFSLAVLGVALFLGIAILAGPGSGGVLGAIRGEDGRLSTSKFQFFVWTAVVIFVWISVNVAYTLSNHVCSLSDGRTVPTFPTNVLLAMGFSVTTLATAKGITGASVLSGRLAKGWSNSYRLSDLVCQDNGNIPDLSKIQMLTWTLIAAASYMFAGIQIVNQYLPISVSHPPCGIPDIDTALMALMGIGQGAYLGSKIVASPGIVLRSLDKPQTFIGDTVTIFGSGFGNTSGSVSFGRAAASLAAGQSWTDGAVKVIVPSINPLDNQPFEPGDTVDVSIALTGIASESAAANSLPFTYSARPSAGCTAEQQQVRTNAGNLTLQGATNAVRLWAQEQDRLHSIADAKPTSASIIYYCSDSTTDDSSIVTMEGFVAPTKPAKYSFFVDHIPSANWEHRCSYVFIDSTGQMEAIESTVPPSTKSNAQLQNIDQPFMSSP